MTVANVSALSFLKCHDNASWIAGTTSLKPHTNRRHFLQQWKNKPEENQLIWVHMYDGR